MVRAAGQLLDRPKRLDHAVDVVSQAAFIQAQDPHAARLGVRARSRGLTAADVDAARTERSLLRGWAMRGTLHLFPAEDATWLPTLFRAQELRWARRRIQELMGLDARAQDRAVEVVTKLLNARAEPVARTEVVAELKRAGYETGSNAIHHLGRLAVLEGAAFLGPEAGTRTTYVSARAWLGELRPPPREAAMEELARRYVRAFGPADERDFAAWSGLGLRECRAALGRIGRELEEVHVGEAPKWCLTAASPRAARQPLLRMLGAFDNHLMGHRSRDVAVPARHLRRVWPGGGIVNAAVLVDGVAVATWKTRRTPGRISIEVTPFERLGPETWARVEAEVADIGRFEGRSAALERRPVR